MRARGKRYGGVHRYLLAPGSRWAMTSAQLREHLGLPAKLPPDFSKFVYTEDGLTIHVRAKTKRGMEKRVFVACPECTGTHWVEAGHLPQHLEAHHPR